MWPRLGLVKELQTTIDRHPPVAKYGGSAGRANLKRINNYKVRTENIISKLAFFLKIQIGCFNLIFSNKIMINHSYLFLELDISFNNT